MEGPVELRVRKERRLFREVGCLDRWSFRQTVTGGPFVATNEALGGFYLVEAADPEQALAFAKLCPAPGGGVELRPIMDTSGGPPSA